MAPIDADQPPVETDDFRLFTEIITAIARELENQDPPDGKLLREQAEGQEET